MAAAFINVADSQSCKLPVSPNDPVLPADPPNNPPLVHYNNARQWLLVCIATACGFVAAFGIGKVPAAIPYIRDEFSTALSWSGALASSYSVIAMLCALLFGVLVSRVGPWRAGATGLLMLAVGGALGAVAPTFQVLLLCRVIEGFGFVAIAVSMPVLIGRICSDQNRPFAMGIWGTFVPGGVAISLFVSPFLLQDGDWRSLWWAGSIVAVLGLLVAFVTLRPAHHATAGPTTGRQPNVASAFTPDTLILAAMFAMYSATYVGLTTFLPTFWSDTNTISLPDATRLAAMVVMLNILGNLSGGWLCSRGVEMRLILVWALIGAGCFACIVYIKGMPLIIQVAASGCCVYLGGMLPATLFSSVTKYSPTPAHNGLLLGLFFQGAGIGQVFGPILFGATVDRFASWYAAPLFFGVAIAIAALLLYLLPDYGSQVNQSND